MKKTEKNQKLKICFFMPMAYAIFNESNLKMGGAEINLYYIAKELAKNKNVQIDFLVGDYHQSDIEYFEGIRLIKLKYTNPEKNKTPFINKILKRFFFYSELLTNNSEIFLTSGADKLFVVYFFVKILKKRKIILRISHDRFCNGDFVKKNGLLGKSYRFALHRIDKIITQNINQHDLLFNTENVKSSIIKNGFPIIRNNPSKLKSTILWVSRCLDWKRPLLFLELAKRLPNEKFIMIATQENKLKDVLIEEVKKITNLELIEYVNFSEIQNYFNNAKCFVNTSIYEGFPNTFIQSFQAGTPVLSYKVNPEEILNTYGIGLCCDDNIEDAINFIKKLNKNKLEKYNNNCKKYVIKNHNIKEKASQYTNIIYKVIQ